MYICIIYIYYEMIYNIILYTVTSYFFLKDPTPNQLLSSEMAKIFAASDMIDTCGPLSPIELLPGLCMFLDGTAMSSLDFQKKSLCGNSQQRTAAIHTAAVASAFSSASGGFAITKVASRVPSSCISARISMWPSPAGPKR